MGVGWRVSVGGEMVLSFRNALSHSLHFVSGKSFHFHEFSFDAGWIADQIVDLAESEFCVPLAVGDR